MSDNAPAVDPATTPEPQAAERTFTQDDVDRIVAERLKRQKQQFADYDDLKEKAGRLAELEAAQMTQAERLEAELKAEREQRAAIESQLSSLSRLDQQRKLLAEMGFAPAAIETLAGRLQGDDADGWKADAERFAALNPAPAAAPAAANKLDPKPNDDTDPDVAGFAKALGVA